MSLKETTGDWLEAVQKRTTKQKNPPNDEVQNYCCVHGAKGRWTFRGSQVPKPQVQLKDTAKSLPREKTLPLAWKNKDLRFYLREIFFPLLYTFFSSRK